MKATPFRASRRIVGPTPDFPADMPYLFNGNVTCATTRLAFGKASAIPRVETNKSLILKRADPRLSRSSLEFCSPVLCPIQVLGGLARGRSACGRLTRVASGVRSHRPYKRKAFLVMLATSPPRGRT